MNWELLPWLIVVSSVGWVFGWVSGCSTLRDKIKSSKVIEIDGKVFIAKEQVFLIDAPDSSHRNN